MGENIKVQGHGGLVAVYPPIGIVDGVPIHVFERRRELSVVCKVWWGITTIHDQSRRVTVVQSNALAAELG